MRPYPTAGTDTYLTCKPTHDKWLPPADVRALRMQWPMPVGIVGVRMQEEVLIWFLSQVLDVCAPPVS